MGHPGCRHPGGMTKDGNMGLDGAIDIPNPNARDAKADSA